MKIKLHRVQCWEKSTLGELSVDNVFFCYVLEDADRLLENNPEDKIHGETAIPRGTYNVVITYSNRFKTEMPLVCGVDGFEGIRIHAGNVIADTHGCPLVGSSYSVHQGVHSVQNSRATYNKLFDLIDTALEQKDTVTLEVA